VFVILSGLGSSVFSGVRNGDLAASSGHASDLEFKVSDRFNNFSLVFLELEDTAVVVVQDHDGGHVRGSELDGGDQLAVDVQVGDLDAVLAPRVVDADVEVLILLKDVVIFNGEGHLLFGNSGSEGQGADGFGVVAVRASGSVFGLVVNLDNGVQVSALADDGDFERSDVLHDGVVGRVEEQPHDSILLLLLFNFLLFDVFLVKFGSLFGEPIAKLLAQVLLSGKLAGGLETVVGARFGSLAHDFFTGAHLQLSGGDVGVFQPDPLHGVDVLATVPLEFGQSGVGLVLLEILELLLSAGSDVGLLRLNDHAALVGAVSLGHVLVAEETPVGHVGGVDGGGEEEEGEDALPDLDDAVGEDAENDVEPDVSEDGPGGGDDEDSEVLDLADLVIGDDVHAETDNHEQVESGRTDDGSRSEISGLEVLGKDFDDRQQDFGGGRAEGHQGQVGNGLVPDFDNNDLVTAALGVLDGDFLLLCGDHFNGLHEPVGHNGDTDEEVDHEEGVEDAATETVSEAEVVVWPPDGNKKSVVAVDALREDIAGGVGSVGSGGHHRQHEDGRKSRPSYAHRQETRHFRSKFVFEKV